MIKGLAHVCFTVQDLEQSVDFVRLKQHAGCDVQSILNAFTRGKLLTEQVHKANTMQDCCIGLTATESLRRSVQAQNPAGHRAVPRGGGGVRRV